MNIVIFGAGAIGSLFGAILSKKNNVILVGRKNHVKIINQKGLKIYGKTNLKVKIKAVESAKKVTFTPNILILTVKSYDTENAIKQAVDIIDNKTVVLSLQNGLDNIDVLKKYVDCEKIFAGVTTHGAYFKKPGVIQHTGFGDTIIGGLNRKKTSQVTSIIDVFNKTNIKTNFSPNIMRDIWVKAIVNSSINPLTTIFECKNGYLTKNPVLTGVVEKICNESCAVAKTQGFSFSSQEMFEKTMDVIRSTSDNYSSMLQSIKRGKKSEIDSINGIIVKIGGKFKIDTPLNKTLVLLVSRQSGESI